MEEANTNTFNGRLHLTIEREDTTKRTLKISLFHHSCVQLKVKGVQVAFIHKYLNTSISHLISVFSLGLEVKKQTGLSCIIQDHLQKNQCLPFVSDMSQGDIH